MLGRRVKETMSAQVAALQALSEGLLTFLFPSQRKMRELLKRAYPQQDLWSSLLQDPLVRQELERLAQAIKELARPLAYAKDATELEHTINDQLLSAYLVWKGELFTLVLNKALPKAGSAAFLDEYASAIQQIQQFFQEQAAHYLDPENVERLESALYGVCLYSENIMRTILEEGPDALDPDAVKDTINDFVKADLLLMTAALILIGEIKPWRWIMPWKRHSQLARILSLITQQAEAHVNAIEDKLLIRDPNLRSRLEQPSGPAISLEECCKQLGLS
jgi:hypothetical protein